VPRTAAIGVVEIFDEWRKLALPAADAFQGGGLVRAVPRLKVVADCEYDVSDTGHGWVRLVPQVGGQPEIESFNHLLLSQIQGRFISQPE
jgi:hypothetical protein